MWSINIILILEKIELSQYSHSFIKFAGHFTFKFGLKKKLK